MVTMVQDDIATRLTAEAIRILGGISTRWRISQEQAAKLANTSSMSYLRRVMGYESRPFDQLVIHRITALGLIDRALANGGIDPGDWVVAPTYDTPFGGRSPIEALPEMNLEELTALNVHLGAITRRPVESSIPFM